MTNYNILVFLHVASVIVWLGTATGVALLALYWWRSRSAAVADPFIGFVGWLGPRVLAPSSLFAFGFGVAAAHAGHWPMMFWFHVGEAAFGISFLLTVLVRVPLLRRMRQGKLSPLRGAKLLLALAFAELTVLYVAVADMIVKPSGADTTALTTGGITIAVGVAAAVATAYRRPADLASV